jgi:hypothetical protein
MVRRQCEGSGYQSSRSPETTGHHLTAQRRRKSLQNDHAVGVLTLLRSEPLLSFADVVPANAIPRRRCLSGKPLALAEGESADQLSCSLADPTGKMP